MTDANLWNQLLIWPITNVLVLYYRLFELLRIPGALGWAVILMTATARVVLYPLMKAQMVSARKMSNLKPHLDEISKKHKEDKKALQEAQLALYKEHGINPAAGCIPLLVQMPVLIALYNVFMQVLGNGDQAKMVETINAIVYLPWMKITSLDLSFLGIDLALKPSAFQTAGLWLLSVPLITAGLQYYQTKLMMPSSVPQSGTSAGKPQNVDKKLKDKKPEEKKDNVDQAGEMQKQMAIISPIMFGMFAFQFPLGLSLYWNVFGLFGILQQLAINKSVDGGNKV